MFRCVIYSVLNDVYLYESSINSCHYIPIRGGVFTQLGRPWWIVHYHCLFYGWMGSKHRTCKCLMKRNKTIDVQYNFLLEINLFISILQRELTRSRISSWRTDLRVPVEVSLFPRHVDCGLRRTSSLRREFGLWIPEITVLKVVSCAPQ